MIQVRSSHRCMEMTLKIKEWWQIWLTYYSFFLFDKLHFIPIRYLVRFLGVQTYMSKWFSFALYLLYCDAYRKMCYDLPIKSTEFSDITWLTAASCICSLLSLTNSCSRNLFFNNKYSYWNNFYLSTLYWPFFFPKSS